jgi:hypothetical protein
MISLTVTIGASATPATTLDLYASLVILKASGTDYLGGPGVTSTTGIPIPATPMILTCDAIHGIALKNLYFAGTQNDTIIIAYEAAS